MKTIHKILSVISLLSWLLTITQVVFLAAIRLKFGIKLKNAASIGIIGSADGPSCVFVSPENMSALGKVLPYCPLIAVLSTIGMTVTGLGRRRLR